MPSSLLPGATAQRILPPLLLGLIGCVGTMSDVERPDSGSPEVDAGQMPSDSGSPPDASTQPPPDSGEPPDSGQATDAGRDAGLTDRIPVFLAQGMMGRSTISCDDGRTWVGDKAWDTAGEPLLCGQTTPTQCDTQGSSCMKRWYDNSCARNSPCDCGHSPAFSKGVAFDGTHFVGTWGWGYPGSVRRSRNGVDWVRSMEGQPGFGGIAYGAGTFVTGDRSPQVSSDGIGWDAGGPANFTGPNEPTIWSVRRFAFANYGPQGRFVAIASGNTDLDILVSSNRGGSWWRPRTWPAGCGSGVGSYGDILSGNGVIVVVGSDGTVCRSTDGGDVWTKSSLGDDIYSSGVWTGSEFWIWSRSARYSSADGTTWTRTALTPAVSIGPVARSPSGTLVAVNNVWNGYSTQRFLRSTDGVTWSTLPTTAFNPSHPIFFITFGLAERSAVCP